MKKVLLVLLLLGAAGSAFAAGGGTPIVGGGTGILTVQSANTVGKGALDLGFYFISPESIAVSLGLGLVEELDLSFGIELDGRNSAADPFFQIRGKYRFSGDGKGDSWALGLDMAIASGASQNLFTLYLVNSYMAGSWNFTWGLGYTFESGDKNNINFMVGISRLIVQNLYLEADFANFPNRYFSAEHGNVARGVGNIGLRFHLFDSKLRLTAGCYDAFDSNRQLGIGVAFKLHF